MWDNELELELASGFFADTFPLWCGFDGTFFRLAFLRGARVLWHVQLD